MRDKPRTEREMIFYKLNNVIRCDAAKLKDDNNVSLDDKLEAIDLLLSLKKFLDNYDEDIEVLRKYHLQKAEQEKWKQFGEEYNR